MLKKKITSWLIIISIVIVALSAVTGMTRLNSSPKAFGVLIDNLTGEDITSIRLIAKPYGKNGEPRYEHEQINSVKGMSPGNYQEFNFYMRDMEEASAEKSDLVITIQLNGDNSANYTIENTTGVPIKEGKRTLIRLIGNKTAGFKSEFVDFL